MLGVYYQPMEPHANYDPAIHNATDYRMSQFNKLWDALRYVDNFSLEAKDLNMNYCRYTIKEVQARSNFIFTLEFVRKNWEFILDNLKNVVDEKLSQIFVKSVKGNDLLPLI